MTFRDQNTIELARQTIRIAEDVVVWPVKERGEISYRLEIPSLHRFFRVGYEEYVLISLLDGKTTIPQACGLAAATIGRRAPTGKQAEEIQRWLLKNELAYLPGEGPPIRRRTNGPNQSANEINLLQRFNPFWIKIPFRPLAKWSRPLAEKLRWCCSASSIVAGIVFILIAVITLATQWDRFTDKSFEIFSPSNFIWLFASWLVLKIIHETAHAVACYRFGGEVEEVGIVLVLFAPLAYVDVSSCWRMNSRWARIAVAGAGMFAELLIASVAMIAWRWTESPEVAMVMQNIVVTASFTTLLFNANVLMRFDGYYILADAIEVSNLYAESMTAVKRAANRWLIGGEDHGGNLSPWRCGFVLAYGLAAIGWKVVVCFTLAVAASTLFSGAGIALAAVGVMIWCGAPAKKLIQFANDLWHRDRARFTRAAMLSGTSIALVVTSVIWFPIPTAVTVAAVTDYKAETILRSGASGFVRRIHVEDMATVQAGDLLIELENQELTDQYRTLEIELAQNEIRKRQAANEHNASAVAVLQETHRALVQQLAQVNSQRQGLRVIAHRSGQVIARDLSTRIGTFVREGDHLMNIAGAAEKEIVAVVSQDAIRQARHSTGREVNLSAADFTTYAGTLERIDPRATNRVPTPSLAATAGGTLAVRRSDDEASGEDGQLTLLEPHFLARISLTPETASETPAGMRMRASFGYRTDPLLTRLRVAMSDIFYRAQDGLSATR